MTNILPNETTYSQLTPSGRALKLWWLYYPVDTTLAKYSSKDCFPSLYFQVANEEISKAQKNNAPNTPAYFCCLFCSKCTVLANLKKKKIKTAKTQQIIHTVCIGSSYFLPLPSVQFHSAGNKRKSQQHSATLFLGSWSSQETRVLKWIHIVDMFF